MTTVADNDIFSKTENVPCRIIEGEAVLVNTNTHEVVHLNETGTFVWENIDGTKNVADIVKLLIGEFDVSEADARRDVLEFTAALSEKGLIAPSALTGE